MTRCLLGIGSNLGDRAAQMDAALIGLREHNGITVVAVSDWSETEPVGGPEKQQTYLNGAILVETQLSATSLLKEILQVELGLGRVRDQRWGPRSVDLDLLLYGDESIDELGLTVPHPWMAIRKFVLDPAEQVAPEMVHPQTGWTLRKLAKNLQSNPLTIAVIGLQTPAQCAAAHTATRDTGAEVVQLSELLPPTTTDRGAAEKLRVLACEPSSVVSDSTITVELLQGLRDAVTDRISSAVDPSSQEVRTLVFDYWWWEACRAGGLAVDEDSRSAMAQPNLLIELVSDQSSAAEFDDFHQGPRLVLPAGDLARLSHDLTAAIQSMQ